ncbi:D-hexose-6-phosphate mutarotase [Candidatus Sulfurimonas marisnigri]|uniref:Putative glucose-6-phosphate 1-epimerase n=1 Tax=Candidatus Sulfurimonas marisnigri TaxID=2740405 RepID=A0A7S7RQK0_9BACT|nr:D-hexose-6-phosphate mutarotase [Candidatus Sulfurimonas marisnigri]QOY54643.1 D-hexose-6-phosphate mutarotase [Candidatus Sulfurimonas marisnigri]
MIEYKKLSNGFEYIEIKNSLAYAKIALQGAHIFHYEQNSKEPILWLSETSDFEIGKSIRGGVPICWPWFGLNKDDSLPQHGFARTSIWGVANTDERSADITLITLKLEYSKESLKLWPYKFELELHVSISDRLTMELKTTNIDEKSFEITQALHTYFSVSDILHVAIRGLDKKPYLDALTFKKEIQSGDITFNQEVDRVYQEVSDEVLLKDKNRILHVENEGSCSVVVWNPWIAKCKRMSAMRDDAYKSMLCIESANAFEDERVIKSNESLTLKATIY